MRALWLALRPDRNDHHTNHGIRHGRNVKQLLILITLLIMGCNDAVNLIDYGKKKYTSAIAEGKAYADSMLIEKEASEYYKLSRYSYNRCKYYGTSWRDSLVIEKTANERCPKFQHK